MEELTALLSKKLRESTDPKERLELILAMTNYALDFAEKEILPTLGFTGLTVDDILDKVIELEGGYINNPSDPGGATMYGISSKWNPEYAQRIREKKLTIDEAKKIYREKYWNVIYKVDELPLEIAWLVFDARVHGSRETVYGIQRFLRNKGAAITVDGAYGPATFGFILQYLKEPEQISELLSYLKDNTELAAKEAAIRTMKSQKENHLPEYNFTKGFESRLNARVTFAETIHDSIV